MTEASVAVTFPRETLAQFGDASGDRSPLHLDEEYARRTPFGQTIIHGSLSLLAMLPRAPLATGSSPFALDAVFRHPVLPGRPYAIEASARADGWRIELLEGDVSITSANVRPVDGSSRATPPGGSPGPMRRDPATPTADELSSRPSAYVEYRPDVETLMSLARTYSDGGEINPAAAAALGWISYIAGMELPGRHSMCRRVKLAIQGPVEPAEAFTSDPRVEMYDERTNLLRVSGSLFQGGPAVAHCTLGIHWRRDPEVDS